MARQLLGGDEPRQSSESAVAPQPQPPRAEPVRPVRFRVLEDVRVSIAGQLCHFMKGAIVDPAHHRPGLAKLFADAGAKVEEVR